MHYWADIANRKEKIMRKKVILTVVMLVIVCFAIVPLIINWLFMQISPIDILTARWTAGDTLVYVAGVLAFIGTVTLGFVSYTQNQNANKISQNSIKIAEKANEINIITRIIDFEMNNFKDLIHEFEIFSNLCLPQNLAKIPCDMLEWNGEINLNKLSIVIDKRNAIMSSFIKLSRILSHDKSVKDNPDNNLKKLFAVIYLEALEYVDYHSKAEFIEQKSCFDNSRFDAYQKMYEDFMKERELYLEQRELQINHLLYENQSLNEIRKMVKQSNGQNDQN